MNLRAQLKVYWPYLVLTAAVMVPLLLPGYILTLDAVFVPRIPAPDVVTSDFLWQWLLHAVNAVVPSQVIEKLIFIGILLGSGIGAHRLIERLRGAPDLFAPAANSRAKQIAAFYAAGVLYMINPFVYDRFMAGQYGVLMGYALLPWVVRAWLELLARPGRRRALQVLGFLMGLSIVSLPMLGLAALAGVWLLAAATWRRGWRELHPLLIQLLIVGGLFVLLSSYWLVPALAGVGATAEQVQGFTAAHTTAFAATGDTPFEKIAAVLRLQGFWAEQHGLFRLPQDQLPGWGTVRLAIWALVGFGIVAMWRLSRRAAVAFIGMAVSATMLAVGAFAPLLTVVGYRESHKFAGLVALAFAVFAAFGAARLFALARLRSDTTYSSALGVIFLILLLFTPTMYWGFAGQLRPRHYPAGWHAANEYLRGQQGDFKAVFLPWHQYMSFEFAGRIIATPAPRFFERPVIASNDPELGEIDPPKGAPATRVGQVVVPGNKPEPGRLAGDLARHNVRYVLLAKDYDWRDYGYMDEAAGLRMVGDWPSLRLYENTAWEGRK